MTASRLFALRTWLGRLFFLSITLTVVAYGSVETAPLNLAAIGFALLAGVSVAFPIRAPNVRSVQAASILLLAGLLLYLALQIVPLPDERFANAAWEAVRENIGPTKGTISVAPGITLEALPSLALPFLVFISSLGFFQGDREALRLWRMLAYFGAAYAAYGLFQEWFFPQQLLLLPKKYGIGSLTATFVNADDAGAFLGIAFVLNLGLAFHELRKIHIKGLSKELFDSGARLRHANARLLIQALLCLITVVALFLTKSRGAVGATFVACVLVVALMATGRLTADRPAESHRRAAIAAAGVSVVVLLFAIFAGRTIQRLEMSGPDYRWCIFGSIIEAIKDNWIFGTGFGTFRDVFPVYRNSDCAGIFGVWTQAHNVFLEGYLGLGLPFALALIIGYAFLISAFIRGARTRERFRFIPIMGLSMLALVSLNSLVEFSLQIPGVGAYFAAAMAAAVSGAQRE
jgi:O-antigen ligase